MSELVVVLENRGASDLLDVINGRFQSDGSCNIGRARLKTVRRLLERTSFKRDTDNHLAAAMPWRNSIQDLAAGIERSDARRPTHFVTGEGKKIAAQLPDIDWQMAHALCCIDQCESTNGTRFLTKVGYRVDCPERV